MSDRYFTRNTCDVCCKEELTITMSTIDNRTYCSMCASALQQPKVAAKPIINADAIAMAAEQLYESTEEVYE